MRKKYQVFNETRGQLLAWDVQLAHSFFTRLKGLLGKRELAPGSGLILKPCNSIHSLMMRFPFDALFLDKKNRVIAMFSDIQPNSILKPILHAVQVVELPTGAILKSGTQLDDQIKIQLLP